MAIPHNILAPELLTRLISETDTEAEALVVLESVTLGFLMLFRPNPFEAGEILDALTQRVIERLQP